MRIENGNAFHSHTIPSFIAVSIYDEHPPGIQWMRGTSLKAFSELVELNVDVNNTRVITDAWKWMKQQAENEGFNNVQAYYAGSSNPIAVYRAVYLTIKGKQCLAMLVHAPDFTKVHHLPAMSILTSLYRTINAMCAMRSGRAEDARMAPLSAGVFSGNHVDDILKTCVRELFTPWSAPITVFGYTTREYDALKKIENGRARQLNLKPRVHDPSIHVTLNSGTRRPSNSGSRPSNSGTYQGTL